MQALIAVVKDLLDFILVDGLGVKKPEQVQAAATQAVAIAPPPPAPPMVITSKGTIGREVVFSPSLHPRTPPEATNTKVFTIAASTALYAAPARTIDGVISTISYGTSVVFLGYQNRWAEVVHGPVRGWLAAEDITSEQLHVQPQFVPGQVYGATDTGTITLRRCIADEFNAIATASPALDIEYVWHRLRGRGVRIDWPEERPRLAGRWQTLLKGKPGVYIGVAPKTGSVLEYTRSNGLGRLAYVETVSPDQSITIGTFGWKHLGQFDTLTITASDWREWRPVFISFS